MFSWFKKRSKLERPRTPYTPNTCLTALLVVLQDLGIKSVPYMSMAEMADFRERMRTEPMRRQMGKQL